MENYNLLELAKTGQFKKGQIKKLTVSNNHSNNYQCYLIPIKYLYYNDLNGRISTFNEEYIVEHPEQSLNDLLEEDKEAYNDQIAKFIKHSAGDKLKSYNQTKDDIRRKGQQQPGVVLSDGRIIDGNRRFTAIRELSKETNPNTYDEQFDYFEAVILEAPEATDREGWKTIKTLELQLQYNVNEKVDYNRIDFLVSFYKDTMIEGALFNKRNYCSASGLDPKQYEKNVKIVKIMLDYLKWRNRPNAFFLLKNEKLDGPLEEFATLVKNMSDDEWNENKDYLYKYMTLAKSGDKTRDIRKLIQSFKKNGTLFNTFKNEINNVETNIKSVKAIAAMGKKPSTTEEQIDKNNQLQEMSQTMMRAFANAEYVDKTEECEDKPLANIETVISKLKKVDLATIKSLGDNTKSNITEKLNELKDVIKEIERSLNEN